MIQLFVKRKTESEYTEIFPDFSQDIKYTKENAYFSRSGTYTLDVTLPMSILQNRKYFHNIHRIEKGKKTESMDVMLMVANYTILVGTAHITEVQQDLIKIQLLGGKSEVKFISTSGDKYIDELTYEKVNPPSVEVPWDKGTGYWMSAVSFQVQETTGAPYVGIKDKFVFVPVYDEEDDVVVNGAISRYYRNGSFPKGKQLVYCDVVQPNLMFVLKSVLAAFGYHIDRNELNTEPYNRIYIAGAAYREVSDRSPIPLIYNLGCRDIAKMLPHWTVVEFIEQIERFFNMTIVFDDVNKTASLLQNKTYYNDIIKLDVEDEFTAELVEESEESDVKILASANIEYDMSDSSEHYIDNVKKEVENAYEKLTYRTYGELIQAMDAMSEEEKVTKIFCYGDNEYIYDTDNKKNVRINHFGRLVRTEAEEDIVLKIAPAAMTDDELETTVDDYAGYHQHVGIISVNTPKNAEDNDSVTVWDAINGEDIEREEKEDRMEVFFVDDKEMISPILNNDSNTGTGFYGHGIGGYTDHELHRYSQTQRESWSLALRPGANNNLGINRLHQSGLGINSKTKYEIKIFADNILPLDKVFMIHNRKFVCEKMEYTISKGELKNNVTGFFYEIS